MWNSSVLIRSLNTATGVHVSPRDYFNSTSRDDQDYKRGRIYVQATLVHLRPQWGRLTKCACK